MKSNNIKITVALLLVMSCATMRAQKASELLASMPDSILPTLTKNNRLDFIDFISSNMKAEVTNRLNGKTTVTRLTDDDCMIDISELTHIQISILNTTDKPVVMFIHSSKIGAWDSDIQFYTTEWKRLATNDFITLPQTEDFIEKSDTLADFQYENILTKAANALLDAKYDTETKTLTLNFTSSNADVDDFKRVVLPHVKPTISYQWAEGKFTRR